MTAWHPPAAPPARTAPVTRPVTRPVTAPPDASAPATSRPDPAAPAERRGRVGRVAFHQGHRIRTHGEVHELAARAASVLAGEGVRPGDRVLPALPDGIAWVTAFLHLRVLGGGNGGAVQCAHGGGHVGGDVLQGHAGYGVARAEDTTGCSGSAAHSASSAPDHAWSGGVPYPTTSASGCSVADSGCR